MVLEAAGVGSAGGRVPGDENEATTTRKTGNGSAQTAFCFGGRSCG